MDQLAGLPIHVRRLQAEVLATQLLLITVLRQLRTSALPPKAIEAAFDEAIGAMSRSLIGAAPGAPGKLPEVTIVLEELKRQTLRPG